MDRVDYVLHDDNLSDDDKILNVTKIAKDSHGVDVIDSILNDDTHSDDDKILEVTRMAKNPPKRLNKEQLPMVDVPYLRDATTPEQIYGGLKNTTLLAKPLSFVSTPITEAVRAPFKWAAENIGENTSQTPPIDTAAEYKTPYPSDRAGLGLLVRDMANSVGIKSSPLVDIQSEDYPKAAEFARQMTDPVNVAGAAADVGIAGGNILPSYVSKLPPGMRPKQILPELQLPVPKMSLEAAADYVRSITKDKALLGELEKSGKIYNVAKMIIDEPEKYLHQFRPNKTYSQIMGEVNPPKGSRLIGEGDLPQMNRYQNDLIETIPRDAYTVPREELQLSALDELAKNDGLEAGQRATAERIIENNIPVMQPDPAKVKFYDTQPPRNSIGVPMAPDDPITPTLESYMDLIRSRNEEPIGYASKLRRLGNKLMEPAIPGEVSTDIQSKNLAGRAIERASRNAQDQAMAFMDNGNRSVYDAQNAKISNLINLRDLTSGNLTSSGANIPAPASMTGRSGFISELGKSLDRYVRPTGSEMLSSSVNAANKLGTKGGIMMGSAQNAANEFVYSKSAVNNFQIPRNAAEIVQYKDMVKLKLKRDFGEEIANAFDSLQSQQEVSNLFNALSQQNPASFEPAEYGEFDGVIHDPIMAQKALQDMVKEKGASPYHKAKQTEALIHHGKLIR